MKRIIITLLLFHLFQVTFSQERINFQAEYVMMYKLVHSPDTNNLESKNLIEYYLFGNSQGSYWVEKGKYISDSAISTMSEKTWDPMQAMQLMNSLPQPKSLATINKNYIQNTIEYYDHIRVEPFYYTEPLNAISWKLENKHREIGGFNCQAATCVFKGRKYEAWFTTDLAMNEGPYKFYGLPGTIVKIQDSKHQVEYELISFKRENMAILLIDKSIGKGATKVSPGEFKRMKMDAIKNPLVGMEDRGIKMDEENQKKVMERAKLRSARFNNPIELED